MPEFHDQFWRKILQRVLCAIDFFEVLLKEKANLLDFSKMKPFREVHIGKRKHIFDLLYEIPLKASSKSIFFLLEHKSRKDKNYNLQLLKNKMILEDWYRREHGFIPNVIPILFYQGLDDRWNPEKDLDERFQLNNPILEMKPFLLVMNLQTIDPLNVFKQIELKAGMALLNIIGKPFEEFQSKYKEILALISELEETKRIDLLEEMEDYIFKSRKEDRQTLEEEIMGKQKVMTLYEKALEEGIEQGIEQGIERGIELGIEKGIEQGVELGRLEGEFRKALETAKRLQEKKYSLSEIQEITGLSVAVLVEYGITSAP
jgi:predicted transposase/invertase (TIGR01784 family)